MKLQELLHETGIKCGGTTENREENPQIGGICCDSRRVEQGDLFVCIRGSLDDGSRHIAEAQKRGAAAVLVSADGLPPTTALLSRLSACFYRHPDQRLCLIGVTGTNGKTTTTGLIHQVLAGLGAGCGLLGTVVYDTGLRRSEAGRTTPPPDQLYRMLSEMEQAENVACAMEVSSHGLALGRVAGMAFAWGAFTNLTEDHLDFHKTMEAYYQAKKQMFYQVTNTSFINIDDPWGRRLYRELQSEGYSCCSVSLNDSTAGIFGQVEEAGAAGSRMQLYRSGRPATELSLLLPGSFNCYNGLLAWAVSTAACEALAGSASSTGIEKRALRRPREGFDIAAARLLAQASGAAGRFQPVENPRGKLVIVDYAHTPDALENVLRAARPLVKPGGRLICVFGCGGDRDANKRPLMGAAAGQLADYSIITSDNPRTEPQERIASQIEEGMCQCCGAYEIESDRRRAIARALALCGPCDAVLIAGKGHETTQTIGRKKYPFDDRQVVQELLKEADGPPGD